MKLSLLTGRDAVDLAQSPAIQSKWKALHAACPWATACQHPDFVLPWYQLYQERFLPVLVLAESASGELQGLLTLARSPGSGAMTGAGERQAEYHAWLAAPDAGDDFIRAAIPALRAAFPGLALRLRYLPPGIPLGWTVERAGCARHCTLHTHRRPVMHVDAAAMARQRSKKNHRQNFNRLQRMGVVAFEKVCGHERFAAVLDDICAQYDFRQGALHHQMPFHADPLKKPFYLELDKRGLLHTSLLTVDGEVAAAHVGLLSIGRAVHLGINTHAPAFAAHSPGNLLLAMLGVRLAEDAMPVLDLTPGGDGYKEHFATGHDLVFELTAYASARQRLKMELLAGAARALKTGLQAVGYRPARVRAALLALKQTSLTRLRSAACRLLPGSRVRALRCPVGGDARQPGDTGVSKNCLDDAMKFDARSATLTYWQFLRLAMDRMERSNDLYSLVRDGKLLVFCWLAMGGGAIFPHELQLLASQPGGTVLLFGLYVHPELAKRECVRGFIQQILYDLQRQGVDRQLHVQCRLSAELQQVFEDSGFTDVSGKPPRLPLRTPDTARPGALGLAPEAAHDGAVVYLHEVPSFIEAELVRLYGSLHASLPFFEIFRSMEGVSSYVAWRDGRPASIFLFSLRGRCIEVLNEMIEVDHDELERFTHYVFRQFGDIDIIHFKAVTTGPGGLGFPLQRYRSKETYVIALPGTPEEYSASIGKATRASIQKQANRVRREFPTFGSEFRTGDQIDESELREIMRLSEAKINAGHVKVAHDATRITALATKCGFVHVLLIDGRVCAGSVNYQVGRGYFGELIGYDRRYEKFGVGKLCLYQAICESIARGGQRFYLGGGMFDYKLHLLARPLSMDALKIYRSRWKMLVHPQHAAGAVLGAEVRRWKNLLHRHQETMLARLVFDCFYFLKNWSWR